MPRKVKLFGFDLTMTSALLLFIFAVLLVFAGAYGIYTVLQFYNATDQFPVGYFMLYALILSLGAYILTKTIKFKNKSNS